MTAEQYPGDLIVENFDAEKSLNHISLAEIDKWVKDEFCHPVPDGIDSDGYHYKIVCEDIESPVIFCQNNRAEGTVRRSVNLKRWKEFVHKVKSLTKSNAQTSSQ